MKPVISICVLCSVLFADGTPWVNWSQAVRLSEKTNKPIMIEAMKDGCKYCVKMDKEVFKDKSFAEYVESKVIPVKINISKEIMPIDEEPMMTPTFYFVNASKNIIKKIPGSWNQEDFRSFLEEVK